MVHRLFKVALLSALLVSCLGDGTCPCGALPSDPLSLHDAAYDGPHRVTSEADQPDAGG